MSNVILVELAKRRLDFSVGPRKKKKVDSSELCREALRNLRIKRGGYKFGCEGKKIKLSEVGNPLDPRMSDGDKIPVSVHFFGSLLASFGSILCLTCQCFHFRDISFVLLNFAETP